MKNIYLLFISILISCTVLLAQTPQSFKYQAVLRNTRGTPLQNKDVELRISILQSSVDGLTVYSETHNLKTNILGMVNLNIGTGDSYDDFSAIDWGIDLYFMKVEMAVGRSRRFVEIGTSQLLSVPYALHSKTAENISGAITETQNLADVLTNNNDGNGLQVKNIANPTDNQDAATKAYVTLRVSYTGDTLYLGSGQHVVIPGISKANSERETVTDYDGNVYDVVTIGTQVWMADNMKVTHYANGTAIPLVTGNTAWVALGDNNTDKAYCYLYNYVNSEYGALYTWAAATDGIGSSSNPSGVQGICPTGWHIPSDDEWIELTDYLGGANMAGGKLKETGTTHWVNPNYGATNESGFTGLPGGSRHCGNGEFILHGEAGRWWSSTGFVFNARYLDLRFDVIGASLRFSGYKSNGRSVRCVKD